MYWLYDSTNHRFVVEWHQVRHYGSSTSETFEVIFYDPAFRGTTTGDGEIWFQYQAVGDASGCSIGIESPSETDGISLLYNGNHPVTFNGPRNQFAIRFTTGLTSVNESSEPVKKPDFAISSTILNSRGALRFSLPERATVDISIFDASGRMVKKVYSGNAEAGMHTLSFELPGSGVYFVRYSVNGRAMKVKKLVSLR